MPNRPTETLNGAEEGNGSKYIHRKEKKKGYEDRQSFLLLLLQLGEDDESFRSGEGERLRSHSAMRLEAVRWSLDGASLVMVGQGMPSVMLGSGAAELGFHSPKLEMGRQRITRLS